MVRRQHLLSDRESIRVQLFGSSQITHRTIDRRKGVLCVRYFPMFVAVAASVIPAFRATRVDPLVTPEESAQRPVFFGVTEEELNSEVELLKSSDLLAEVVVELGLHGQGEPGGGLGLGRLFGPPADEPGGEDPCPFNPDLTADDPDCEEPGGEDPCPFNPDLAADDPDCEEPVEELEPALTFDALAVCELLEDDLDLARGDMVVKSSDRVHVSNEFNADICWLDEQPLDTRRKYLVKHGTRTVKAWLSRIEHRVDVDTSQLLPGIRSLQMNDIARIGIKSQQPLVIDSYACNRATGSFIVIDEATHHTVGAGLIA